MNYEDIEKHVHEVGFKRHYNCALPDAAYGTDDISEGILFASQDPEFVKQTSEATKRFYNGDWGTFLCPGEVNFPGAEYGEYPSKFGYIYIHRENSRTVMYFMFER